MISKSLLDATIAGKKVILVVIAISPGKKTVEEGEMEMDIEVEMIIMLEIIDAVEKIAGKIITIIILIIVEIIISARVTMLI